MRVIWFHYNKLFMNGYKNLMGYLLLSYDKYPINLFIIPDQPYELEKPEFLQMKLDLNVLIHR